MIGKDDRRILSSGYRVAMRRAQRRYKRMRNVAVFIAIAALIGGIASVALGGLSRAGSVASKAVATVGKAAMGVANGIGGLFRGSEKPAAERIRKAAATNREERIAGKPTLLIIGLDEKTGRSQAKGVVVVRFDIKEKRIDGIVVPGNTFLTVSGQGREELTVAYDSGRDVLLQAVRDVIPLTPDGVLETKYADYERLAFNKDFKNALEKSTVINMDPGKVKELGRFAAKLNKEEINLIPLSVKSFAVGEDVYYEPDQVEVARLLKLVWGINKKVIQKPRIIVLNGNGRPGIGAQAAAKLAEAGFEVVETKNADRFDYALTKVLVYGTGTEGERIKKAIGVGVVENQRISTNVADYAVILGADYELENSR